MLNLMPNLQDTEFSNFRTRALPLTFRGPKALLPAGLRHLTSLVLEWKDTGYGFGIEDIVACMCLPSLKRLNINPINNDQWDSHDEVACQKISTYNASSGLVELTINF